MILFLLTSLLISNAQVKPGIPVYLDINSKYSVQKNGVLRGNISVGKDLPEEFYGTWAVKSTIIETNNPELFRNKSADIWVFDRNGEIITLSNPVTGATASITVNEVIGKKAKFTRESLTKSSIETETPEVVIENDNFSGEDKLIIKHLYREKIYKTDVVKYKVEGRKVSGPALKDLFAK
jgi:hypothetical protein